MEYQQTKTAVFFLIVKIGVQIQSICGSRGSLRFVLFFS